MAIVTTNSQTSFPLVAYVYDVTGLVAGANTITLPTPPAAGSFPPANDWVPTFVFCFPNNSGAVGAVVTPDVSSISSSAGIVTFTLYSDGSTNCRIYVA